MLRDMPVSISTASVCSASLYAPPSGRERHCPPPEKARSSASMSRPCTECAGSPEFISPTCVLGETACTARSTAFAARSWAAKFTRIHAAFTSPASGPRPQAASRRRRGVTSYPSSRETRRAWVSQKQPYEAVWFSERKSSSSISRAGRVAAYRALICAVYSTHASSAMQYTACAGARSSPTKRWKGSARRAGTRLSPCPAQVTRFTLYRTPAAANASAIRA